MVKLEKLVIDRARWGKGCLLDHENKMCCLGFASVACGVPEDQLGNVRAGDGGFQIKACVYYPRTSWPVPEWTKSGPQAQAASWLNDTLPARQTVAPPSVAAVLTDAGISTTAVADEADREARLTKLFSFYGTELTFEGDRPT